MEIIIGVIALAVVCGCSFGAAYGILARRKARKVKPLIGVVLPQSKSCICEGNHALADKVNK